MALAAQKETVISGTLLLFVFSIGLGVPFLLAAAAIQMFFSVFSRIKKYFHWIEVMGGTLLTAMGILLLIGGFSRLASFAAGLPEFGLGPSGENLSIFSAFLAGLLAFLSPCVLPLIPGYIAYISGTRLEDLVKK